MSENNNIPVKQSLFAIQMDLEDIFLEIEEAGGEVNDDILAKLAITEENFRIKLDSYRKAYTALSYEVEAGKKEKTRIDGIIKTRQNNAERLKRSMYEAVVNFGETGKSGNKVVNLVDSKLYTKSNEVCIVNEQILLILKDIVFNKLRELWQNDMLIVADTADSIDPQSFVDVVNAEFTALHTELAKTMLEKQGHLFTVADLDYFNIKVEFETNVTKLLNKSNFNVLNAYFDCEHFGNVIVDNSTAANKAAIKAGNELSFADICHTESLIIK